MSYDRAVAHDDVFELQLRSAEGTELSPPGYRSQMVFQLQTPIPLSKGVRRFMLALAGGYIARSITQVNERNRQFVLTIDGTPYTCTLGEGNYNALQLKSEIESKAQAATSQTFDCTYSAVTNKITLSIADTGFSSITLSFVSGASAHQLLGFSEDTHAFALDAGAWSVVSDTVVNVSSTPSVSIMIENMSFSDSLTIAGASSILRKVFFSRGFNSIEVLSSNFIDWKLCSTSSGEINSFIIAFRDSEGRLVNFNSVDWELSLFVRRISA